MLIYIERQTVYEKCFKSKVIHIYIYIPTPPLRQDMTQGQFLSGV